jgi:hypothetical protein
MPMHDWSKVTPGEFHDFHGEWISATRRVLLDGVLPPQYYVAVDQHILGFIPDVLAMRGQASKPRRGTVGPVELKEPRTHPSVQTGVAPYFRTNRRLEIYQAGVNRLVAVIEVVSNGNKNSQSGIDAFLRKSLEFLNGGIHLVVFDALPRGNFEPQGIHAAIWERLTGESVPAPTKPLTIVSYAAGTQVRAYVDELAPGDRIPDTQLFLEDYGCVEIPTELAYTTAFQVQPTPVQDLLDPRP